jgi:thioredoxin 1
MIFKDGKVQATQIGAVSKTQLTQLIDKTIQATQVVDKAI